MPDSPAQPAKTFIGVGELLWDCFPTDRRPGGAPANEAFHANQLGLRGVVVSRVGDDEDGRALLAHLMSHNLTTDHIQIDPRLPTGSVTVHTPRPDAPAYTIHENVAWDAIAWNNDLADLAAGADAICFGTLAQRCAITRETIRRLLEAAPSALKVYDVNLRPPWFQRDWIDASLRRADAVKLNEDEVTTLASTFGWNASRDESPIDAFCNRMFDDYALRLVCITRGKRGCHVRSPDTVIDVAGHAATPAEPGADSVGAGDAFTAALIHAILTDHSLEQAARRANRMGALVASRRGAMPEFGGELARLDDSR
jgi:fructokinase